MWIWVTIIFIGLSVLVSTALCKILLFHLIDRFSWCLSSIYMKFFDSLAVQLRWQSRYLTIIRRKRSKYSPIFTEPKANDCFSTILRCRKSKSKQKPAKTWQKERKKERKNMIAYRWQTKDYRNGRGWAAMISEKRENEEKRRMCQKWDSNPRLQE